jgi:hypothetical protein
VSDVEEKEREREREREREGKRQGPTTDLLEAFSGFRVILRRAERQWEEGEWRGERSGLPEICIVFFCQGLGAFVFGG